MCKVAVFMSTYNGEKFLVEQIESILRQTVKCDIFIRDDGSTDKTQNILNEYQNKGLIKWKSNTRLGPAYSFMQLLMDNVGYDYYCFSDQDDWWFPEKTKKEIESIKNYIEPAIVYSNGNLVDSNMNTLGRNIYRNIPFVNFESVMVNAGVQGCTMLWNNAMHERIINGGIPDVLIMHDSYLARVCLATNGKVEYIHEPLIKYRQHEKNVIGIKKSKIDVLKSRIKQVLSADKISIAEQALEIKRIYEQDIPLNNIVFIDNVINYKKTLKTRMKMINNNNIHYQSKNMEITMKLKILFGNR